MSDLMLFYVLLAINMSIVTAIDWSLPGETMSWLVWSFIVTNATNAGVMIYRFGLKRRYREAVLDENSSLLETFLINNGFGLVWLIFYSGYDWWTVIKSVVGSQAVCGLVMIALVNRQRKRMTDQLSVRSEIAANAILGLQYVSNRRIGQYNIPAENGSVKFALYLRSFSLSNTLYIPNPFFGFGAFKGFEWLRDTYFFETFYIPFELVIHRFFQTCFHVIAVGDGGEIGGFGCIKSFGDHEWKQHTASLIRRAENIFVFPGVTPACRWEIEELKRCGRIPETIFIAPPKIDSSARKGLLPTREFDEEGYWKQMQRTYAGLGVVMPDYQPEGAMFFKVPGRDAFIGVRLDRKLTLMALTILLSMASYTTSEGISDDQLSMLDQCRVDERMYWLEYDVAEALMEEARARMQRSRPGERERHRTRV